MFHNHSQKEVVQKFVSIDTTFINNVFGPNNNNSVMFGGTNIKYNSSMIQYPHSSTNAAILSNNYDKNISITSLETGINNRRKINNFQNKVFKVCPSNFIIHLPETLSNVIQMKVCALDLPYPMFNISPYHKNNYVEIDDGKGPFKIELLSGNYTTKQIISFLNKAIVHDNNNKLNSNLWRFFYNPVAGKVFFSFSDGTKPTTTTTQTVTLKFSNETESCEGPKKYMSLGTVLGFRKQEYKYAIDYLDFTTSLTDSFIIKEGISQYTNVKETCNWPIYSRVDTFVPNFEYLEGSSDNYYTPQGFIAEGSPTDNASSYLWLVIDDFVKEQKTAYMVASSNRSEINSAKIYCKIPLKEGKVTFDTSYFVDDYKREYFNPTNIDKLHIKLIEPSGMTSYFAHSNFNLDIQFSCLR